MPNSVPRVCRELLFRTDFVSHALKGPWIISIISIITSVLLSTGFSPLDCFNRCEAMLPSSAATISSYSLAPIQNNYSPAFPHSNHPEYLPQSLADQSLDPNSPDIFKQNMQLVQQHVARVNSLARSALNGM
jgi:hypothetical protein